VYIILARYHPRTRPLLYHEDRSRQRPWLGAQRALLGAVLLNLMLDPCAAMVSRGNTSVETQEPDIALVRMLAGSSYAVRSDCWYICEYTELGLYGRCPIYTDGPAIIRQCLRLGLGLDREEPYEHVVRKVVAGATELDDPVEVSILSFCPFM
jgi:hypothetical protein